MIRFRGDFLFQVMQKMNISGTYISWVKPMFESASVVVNLYGNLGNNFKVKKGVRQGCLVAPYLFLIVGEVLTHIIKKAVATRGGTTKHIPVCR